jgi:hypothetical protein
MPAHQFMDTTVPSMRHLFLVLICVISCGCSEPAAPINTAPEEPASPRAEVRLTVLVVDDAEIAQGIRLLAGEWNERSGGQLEVKTATLSELLGADKLTADVVLFPSRQLGALVARKWLRPLRQNIQDDSQVGFSALLPTVREQCLPLGTQVWGLSLGEQPVLMAWHGDIPKTLPTTWEEVDRLAGPSDGSFPLAAEFLARVVAATPKGERASLLFDPATMDACLTQPQFVHSLEQMQAARQRSKTSAALSFQVSTPPQDWEGVSGLTPLPPTEQVFQASRNRWEKAEDTAPPLVLGFDGRMASVTQASRNAASAFKLLAWLCGGETGEKLSQRSHHALWFKTTQAAQAQKWFPDKIDQNHLSAVVRLMESREAYLLPRLPGIDDYLQAMNTALSDTEKPPTEILNAVQRKWDDLTDSLGRESQLAAYRLHLGL